MVTSIENNLLKGMRILELTNNPSVSYAGRLLAVSGAKVTKVITDSLLYSNYRDEKKTIINLINRKNEQARWRALLSGHWDIILSDNKMSHELNLLLKEVNQKINSNQVEVKIDFPSELSSADESSLQAFAGWSELTGEPDREPLVIGGFPASYLIGAHAATAGLTGLLERKWTKKAKLIELNVTNILLSALEGAYSNFKGNKTVRTRVGNRHNTLSPMAILPSANNELIFVGAPVDDQWEVLERWSEIPHSNKWSKGKDRLADTKNLEAELSHWTKTSSREELFLTGQALRMPFAKVQTLEEVRNCTHLNERKLFLKENSKVENIRPPWKLTESKNIPSKNESLLSDWKDLRILDLTSMWSGPYCTRILADSGAEVIKVEAPHRPDGIRGSDEKSAPFFKELNRNKYGVTLDLKMEKDKDIFLELVKTSDVIIDNFSPRVMANFGLTKEVLWKYQPNLIIISLSAFGQEGPYRDFVGYGPTLESMSGIASTTHYSNNKPELPGFSISDIHAGIHGAFSLLTGILYKERTNNGLRIDISQYEVGCQLVGDYLLNDLSVRKQNKNLKHRILSEVVEDKNLTNIRLNDGSTTLGQPWLSKGWLNLTQAAPEIGEHNYLLKSFVNKSKIEEV